jgi:transcription antitermination protein NusB
VDQRHRVRQLALQGLCCFDVQGDNVLDLIMEFISDCNASPDTIGSARELLSGALGDTDRCNEYLQRHCRHWGLARLALVDRSILRLGVHELLDGRTPPKVVIAESLKLAREFSTAESPRFINGVLDSVAKELATGNGQLATGNDNDND